MTMEKKIKNLGVMVDCSRNACYKTETVEKFIDCIARMGYNVLMLYTEDTYTLEGEPYFGYMRGRYGKEEWKQLDAYARLRGVELIPCIQTLAHLGALAGIRGKVRGRKRYSSRRSAGNLCADRKDVSMGGGMFHEPQNTYRHG